MANIGINLQIRNMENRLIQALNEFPDVPIEVKRIAVQGVESRILIEADRQTQLEMDQYEQEMAAEQEQAQKKLQEQRTNTEVTEEN